MLYFLINLIKNKICPIDNFLTQLNLHFPLSSLLFTLYTKSREFYYPLIIIIK
jgi:hypothetical protein